MPADRPAVFTIAPHRPFADTLAAGILDRWGADPAALPRMVILLPTRRACRSLREAFLRAGGGKPMLLPRMRPIGDIDEDELILTAAEAAVSPFDPALPPAIGETRRRLLLARLILSRPENTRADQAVWLAAELARLLDQVQTERLGFDGLEALAPDALAAHWQETLEFLHILTDNWPAILADEGAIDPADRRNRLIEAQAAAWAADPPADPVIAAGSTGSIPATADLLAVVAGLPQGAAVLPGLDKGLDPDGWTAVAADQTHPQHGLARLLDRFGLDRDQIEDWPAPGDADDRHSLAPPARAILIGEALRPAPTTDRWRAAPLEQAAAVAALRDRVSYLPCPGPREEAGVIALAMRQALETPRRTAALVTQDRDLARRVAVELGRWGIAIDDSAGTPLGGTPPGSFLGLVADMVLGQLAPVPLLAALKHPLAAAGLDPAAFRSETRRAERLLLRGPRPGPGLDGLRVRLAAVAADQRRPPPKAEIDRTAAWIGRLEGCIAPLVEAASRPAVSVVALLRAHVAAAEALAATGETGGAARLWSGEAGEEAAAFVDDLDAAAADFPDIPPAQYPELFAALMAGRAVRPRWGAHPRLAIWGPLEARLQQADLTILGGLNEGSWPPEPPADPWMSRPMRAQFGLPLPERRIGLSAHDFTQGFCAPTVLLTRAERVEGTPTVPSRWLTKLEAVLDGLGIGGEEAVVRVRWRDETWLPWFRQLDAAPPAPPLPRPAPRPALAARPRKLSVTQIETWMRDPYAIYARHILGLSALDPLDADPGAAERGQFIHQALDAFIGDHPSGPLPPDALDRLLACGRAAMGDVRDRPEVQAFWWPRFERIARWFVEVEGERRPTLDRSWTELQGSWSFAAPGGDFTLTARADRIDRFADGGADIIDYKTGTLPTKKEVEGGLAPQLPLESLILAQGGFNDVPALVSTGVAFWRVRGADPAGETLPIPAGPNLIEAARDGLARLVAHFDDEATPYAATPHPDRALRFNDYAHLARDGEWSAEADGEGTA